MSKNRTKKQKRLAGQPTGGDCVRTVRQFVMYVGLDITLQIKENSP